MLFIPKAVQERLEDLAKQFEKGDKVEAARRILEAWPGWPDSWVTIGLRSKGAEEIAAFWKAVELGPCRAEFYLALMEDVPSGLVESFKPDLGDRPAEPEAYEMLARSEDFDLKPTVDPPDVADRLRPYRLLNDVQRDARDGLPEETLRKIIEHAGEIGGPELVDDLIDLADSTS